MLSKCASSMALAILVASQILSPALGCSHSPRSEPQERVAVQQFPFPIPGSDVPADPATTGYFINHLCINVKNLTRTIDFYTHAFGMRHMFTLRATKHLSIAYMGHSHGGRNGTGYQTAEEINRQKNNIEGLIEFVHLDVADNNLTASSAVPNTFGHIGIVVPDVQATQRRLEELGANILKSYGEPPSQEGRQRAIALSLGGSDHIISQLDPGEAEEIWQVLTPTNTPLIFLEDPDGNVIEVQNQEGSELV